MSDSSQLATARTSEDGEVTIPISVCESVDIDPPESVFLDTTENQIRIMAEVDGVQAADHGPEVAVEKAREARRNPDPLPTFDEIIEGIAAQSHETPEEVREFLLGE